MLSDPKFGSGLKNGINKPFLWANTLSIVHGSCFLLASVLTVKHTKKQCLRPDTTKLHMPKVPIILGKE